MNQFKKNMKDHLLKRITINNDFKEELTNIYMSIYKLITDRFLSERTLSNIWREMCVDLAYIQLADYDFCELIIRDIINQLDYIRNQAIIAEEYETVKNTKTFFENMLLSTNER